MCDFQSDYDNSQTFLTIWRLWLTNSVKTAYIDGVYELNQISYVHLLKVTQHTTFVYVISWNSDKIVDSIYVMCWTALKKDAKIFLWKSVCLVWLRTIIVFCLTIISSFGLNCVFFFFFCDGRGSNPELWIYYPLFLLTELSYEDIMNCVLRLLRCFKVFTWTFSWHNLFKC